jgi:PAS domain S-box-containing protein
MTLLQNVTPSLDLVQETLLGEALEHAPVGAIVLDDQGRYLAANRLACRLTGYTRDELLRGGAAALSFEPDAVPTILARIVSGELRDGRGNMKRKDGTPLACEYRVGETRSGGLPFYVFVFWEPLEAAA